MRDSTVVMGFVFQMYNWGRVYGIQIQRGERKNLLVDQREVNANNIHIFTEKPSLWKGWVLNKHFYFYYLLPKTLFCKRAHCFILIFLTIFLKLLNFLRLIIIFQTNVIRFLVRMVELTLTINWCSHVTVHWIFVACYAKKVRAT